MAHRLEKGVVTSSREVVIDGQATMMGTSLGAAVGSVAGTAASGPIDDNRDLRQAIGTGAVGGVLGGMAGRVIEKKLTEKKAQELSIQLESGERVIIIQPLTDRPFEEQETVLVYTTMMGSSRIFHEDEDPYVDPETRAYIIDEDYEAEDYEPVTW